MPIWIAQKGIVTGHHHVFSRSNCQDAVNLFQNEQTIIGVVCDGCGSCPESEIGAKIIAAYLPSKICRYIHFKIPLDYLPTLLFNDLKHFIRSMTMLMEIDEDEYRTYAIYNYWLCTIVVMVIHNDQGLLFYLGDPCIAINDKIDSINQRNMPIYLGYACISDPDKWQVPPSHVPTDFEIQKLDISNLHRIMIATDGFESKNDQKLAEARIKEPGLPDRLHGQQWGIKGKIGLQLWMNTRLARGYFDDDCAMVVVEKIYDSQDCC